MSCFALPSTFCTDIQNLLANYWWGSDDKRKGIHWKKWEKLCLAKKDGGLGFRHILSFNQAMLAKQLWRFVENPNSLCAQIFRSRYFPHGNLLSAELGVGASYTWRSLCSVRYIIEKGSCWRVGSGSTIRILKDKWIPSEPCGRPLVTKQPLPFEYVCNLINPISREWKEGVIRDLFTEDTATNILKIPLSNSRLQDSLFWFSSKDGRYSVKSGYFFALSENTDNRNEASSSNPKSAWWNRLWALKIQPKVKHCLWSAATNSLPCFSNLKRRGIVPDSVCAVCKMEEDSQIHIFKLCRFARSLWKELGLQVHKLWGTDCFTWFQEVFNSISMLECDIFCVAIWALWWEHNRRVHGEKEQDCSVLAEFIRSHSHSNYFSSQPVGVEPMRKTLKSWSPPSDMAFKLNVDAAFPSPNHKSTAGFVVRDSRSSVLLSGAAPIGFCFSAFHAELSSILAGLKYSLQAGFSRILVASDCLAAIQACSGPVAYADYSGAVLEDIRLLCKDFKQISFVFECREANNVAHSLAKWGSSLVAPVILLEEVPSSVLPCIAKETV